MKKITFAILAIAFIAAFNSCKEEEEIQTPDEDNWEYFMKQYDENTPHTPGTFVMFGANTYFKNGDEETRTQYSGVRVDDIEDITKKYERIDWVNGDELQIYYNQSSSEVNYAVYAINTHTENERQSVATVTLVSEQGLKWGETGPHVFHGVYPALETIEDYSTEKYPKVVNGENAFTFTSIVPSEQSYEVDMDLAGMVAKTTVTSGKGNVSLYFYPMVTTLQFNLTNVSKNDITIKSIYIDAPENHKKLSGTYSVTVSSDKATIAGTQDVSIHDVIRQNTISVSGINQSLTKGSNDVVKVVMFALPIVFTNAKLAINMDIKETINGQVVTHNVTRKVALNEPVINDGAVVHDENGKVVKQDIVFQPTHKYNFTIKIPDSTVFEVEEDKDFDVPGGIAPITVTSYTYNAEGEKTPLAWTATRYSIDGKAVGAEGKRWNTFNESVLTPDDYGIRTTMLQGWGVFNTVGAPVSPSSFNATVSYNKPTYRKLKEAPLANNVDLSLRDVSGNTTSRNTANCYMVHAGGTYRFPIVYGNAIKNGVTNTMAFNPTYHDRSQQEIADSVAYTPVAGDDNLGWNHGTPFTSHFLSPFVDFQQNDITKPEIEGVSDVVLVWQDAKDLITSVSLEGGYVKFTVTNDMDDLVEGNALIAVTDGTNILWSWHIWITEMTGEKNITTSSSTLMSKELVDNAVEGVTGARIGAYVGFCDLSVGPREIVVEFVQEGTGATDYVTLTQKGRLDGNAPLYQYGRKDPLQSQSGLYEGEGRWTDKPFYNLEGGDANMTIEDKSVFGTSGKKVLAECIMRPNTFCLNTDGTHSMDDIYYNLWAAHNTRMGLKDQVLRNGSARIDKSKTIYDPCPVGYRVPSFEDVEPWRRYLSYSNEDEHFAIFTLGGNRVYLPAITGKLYSNGSYGTKWWQKWEFSSWVSNPNCYSIVASHTHTKVVNGVTVYYIIDTDGTEYNKGSHIPEAVYWRNTGNCLSRWVVAGQTCYQIRFDYNTCWMNENGATRANACNILMIQESDSDSYYVIPDPSGE